MQTLVQIRANKCKHLEGGRGGAARDRRGVAQPAAADGGERPDGPRPRARRRAPQEPRSHAAGQDGGAGGKDQPGVSSEASVAQCCAMRSPVL